MQKCVSCLTDCLEIMRHHDRTFISRHHIRKYTLRKTISLLQIVIRMRINVNIVGRFHSRTPALHSKNLFRRYRFLPMKVDFGNNFTSLFFYDPVRCENLVAQQFYGMGDKW